MPPQLVYAIPGDPVNDFGMSAFEALRVLLAVIVAYCSTTEPPREGTQAMRMLRALILLDLLTAATATGTPTSPAPRTTRLSNALYRRSDASLPFDAHDGSTRQFERGGPYYYHAMGYGTCAENGRHAEGGCGQTSNNTVGVWRSTDLSSGSWELLSSFRPSATATTVRRAGRNGGGDAAAWPNCTYFRSHALYSAATGRYVLWLNGQKGRDTNCTACTGFAGNKCYLAGSAEAPEGPFRYEGVVKGLRYLAEAGGGDFSLFQDDDAGDAGDAVGANSNAAADVDAGANVDHITSPPTSYAIYKLSGAAKGTMAHRMTLQRLTPDLLSADPDIVTSSAGIFGAPFVEAPAMFKRRNTYYALFGQCCAFCAHGAGIGVYTAADPLGPWTDRGNIGCARRAGGRGGEGQGGGGGGGGGGDGAFGGGEGGTGLPLGCGCGANGGPVGPIYNLTCPAGVQATTFAQQNSVIVTGGGDFIWTGDRWQSACAHTVASQGLPPTGLPIELDCVKAYDLQYWSVLKWSNGSDSGGGGGGGGSTETDAVPPLPGQVAFENTIEFEY